MEEFQDISSIRFNLVHSIVKMCNSKLIVVGDDWQSIYGFSGSNIALFYDFQKKIFPTQMLKITNTYRNSQNLIDIVGGFIQKNPNQITKHLVSSKSRENPIIGYQYAPSIISYDDFFDVDIEYDSEDALLDEVSCNQMDIVLEKCLDDIIWRREKDGLGIPNEIVILYRYNFELKDLESSPLFKFNNENKKNRIISEKYPDLDICHMTIHSSKGLGFDEVILMNLKDDKYGFPSQIEEDEIYNYVTEKKENFLYAEERRLFYVALTRTRNRVYLLVPDKKISEFYKEIEDSVLFEPKLDVHVTPVYNPKYNCFYCNSVMHEKKYEGMNKTIYKCSNKNCNHATIDLERPYIPIVKCECCENGILISKRGNNKSFLGCNNFNNPNICCKNTINISESNYAKNEKSKIENFLDKRRIKNLYHFTDIKNLKSIILNGLQSVASLSEKGIVFKKNDDSRADGELDHISVSISKINSKVLNAYVNSCRIEHAVIVEIDSSILYEHSLYQNHIFCQTNAATKESFKGRGSICLFKMFDEEVEYKLSNGNINKYNRKTQNLKLNEPTTPQAEILINKEITVNFIKRIYSLEGETNGNKNVLYANPKYFR